MGVVENQERSCLRQQDCADPYDGDPQGGVDAQAVEPVGEAEGEAAS